VRAQLPAALAHHTACSACAAQLRTTMRLLLPGPPQLNTAAPVRPHFEVLNVTCLASM
jgi:hypothetical protein